MFFEEKIDRLKSETNPKDFRVPFTDGSTILKNIEARFIIKADSHYRLSNWNDRIKDKLKIKNFRTTELNAELTRLNPYENYWVVLSGGNPTTKNLVYDSKASIIARLIGLKDGDFNIVDKQYNWLTYFRFNQTDIDIFKSGDKQTPWN